MQFITTRKTVPIDSVVKNSWNPNQESETVYNSIKETVKQKGMVGTITVREKANCYEIINGEHRWRILKELGYTEIPVETMGEISDEDAYFWTLKLNEGGKNDLEKLVKVYDGISDSQLSLLGTSQEEIQNTKNLFKFDFSQYNTKEPEIDSNAFVNVLSFKFTDTEWKVVNDGIQSAKANGQTEKQWFILMLQEYLRKNSILSGFETLVGVDN